MSSGLHRIIHRRSRKDESSGHITYHAQVINDSIGQKTSEGSLFSLKDSSSALSKALQLPYSSIPLRRLIIENNSYEDFLKVLNITIDLKSITINSSLVDKQIYTIWRLFLFFNRLERAKKDGGKIYERDIRSKDELEKIHSIMIFPIPRK